MDDDGATTESGRSDAILESIHATHDWAISGRPSIGVIEAVADATDRDMLDLRQLPVDADALDILLGAGRRKPADCVRVSLEYEDLRVQVDSDGDVVVRSTPL